MTARRMLPYILLNIVVSAAVILSLLFWWDSRQPELVDVPAGPTQVAVAAPLVAAPNPGNPEIAAPTTAFDEPEPGGPRTYIVKVGDTLGFISQQFDVPLQDILTANGLSDPNLISVGQELIIPIDGLPTATAVPAATEDAPPTPIATVATDSGAGADEEIQVTVSDVIAAGRLESEAVAITNLGSRPIALLDWQLTDDRGREYTFGQVTLFGDGAAILVHTTAGVDGPTDLYWGESEALWAPGSMVSLRDAAGTVRASFVVPDA